MAENATGSVLVEPEIVSKGFRLSRTPLDYRAECVTGYEGREPGDSVPHYAPDQNPFADEFVKLYHLPREAVLGFPETLYPEYRKKIKDVDTNTTGSQKQVM